ncbi:MAG: TetR/AcrR family transcriptional regulator C-terminal domain-containing protein, partial [Myxococcota bacterium]
RACFEFSRENGKLEDMLMMAKDPALANETMHSTREVVIAALTQAFVQWRAAGWIETNRPDIAASLLFGLVSHGIHECVSLRGGEELESYIDEAVACIEGALGYEGH